MQPLTIVEAFDERKDVLGRFVALNRFGDE